MIKVSKQEFHNVMNNLSIDVNPHQEGENIYVWKSRRGVVFGKVGPNSDDYYLSDEACKNTVPTVILRD